MSTLGDLIRFLKLSGHYYDFRGSPRANILYNLQVARVVFISTGNLLALYAIYRSGVIKNLGIVLFLGVVGIIDDQHSLMFFAKRHLTTGIFNFFLSRQNTRERGWENDVVEKRNNLLWKTVSVFANAQVYIFGFYLIVPLTLDVFYAFFSPEKAVISYPKPFNGLIEDEKRRSFKYFVVSMYCLIYSTVAFIANMGHQSIVAIVAAQICSEVEILRQKMKNFGEEIDHRTGKDLSYVKRHLDHFTIEHQKIIAIYWQARKLFGLNFAVQRVLGSVCNCILLYSAALEQDKLVVIYDLYCVFAWSFQMFWAFYGGQQIKNHSEILHQAVYEIPWHQFSPRDRHQYLLILSQSMRVMAINYRGVVPLDVETFMKIMQSSFSYFTVLRSVI